MRARTSCENPTADIRERKPPSCGRLPNRSRRPSVELLGGLLRQRDISTAGPAVDLVRSLQRIAGNRAVQGLLNAEGPAPRSVPQVGPAQGPVTVQRSHHTGPRVYLPPETPLEPADHMQESKQYKGGPRSLGHEKECKVTTSGKEQCVLRQRMSQLLQCTYRTPDGTRVVGEYSSEYLAGRINMQTNVCPGYRLVKEGDSYVPEKTGAVPAGKFSATYEEKRT